MLGLKLSCQGLLDSSSPLPHYAGSPQPVDALLARESRGIALVDAAAQRDHNLIDQVTDRVGCARGWIVLDAVSGTLLPARGIALRERRLRWRRWHNRLRTCSQGAAQRERCSPRHRNASLMARTCSVDTRHSGTATVRTRSR